MDKGEKIMRKLFSAVEEHTTHGVKQLLSLPGVDVNKTVKYDGRTLLHASCKKGHLDIVQLLLKSKANVNVLTECRHTPLHFACDRGHNEIVQILLESGAHLNVQTMCGRSPLHLACYSNHPNTVRILLDSGADLNIKEGCGWAPLHFACKIKDDSQIVKLLLDKGANVNARTKVLFTLADDIVVYNDLNCG